LQRLLDVFASDGRIMVFVAIIWKPALTWISPEREMVLQRKKTPFFVIFKGLSNNVNLVFFSS